MPFTNKTAIVTGAGGGMGLNIARDLIRWRRPRHHDRHQAGAAGRSAR